MRTTYGFIAYLQIAFRAFDQHSITSVFDYILWCRSLSTLHMIRTGEVVCPKCGGALKYYDTVARGIRGEYGIKTYISVRRLRCGSCMSVHRELPEIVEPYVRYESRIIFGLMLGTLKKTAVEFVDYPSRCTFKRWFARFTSTIMQKLS